MALILRTVVLALLCAGVAAPGPALARGKKKAAKIGVSGFTKHKVKLKKKTRSLLVPKRGDSFILAASGPQWVVLELRALNKTPLAGRPAVSLKLIRDESHIATAVTELREDNKARSVAGDYVAVSAPQRFQIQVPAGRHKYQLIYTGDVDDIGLLVFRGKKRVDKWPVFEEQPMITGRGRGPSRSKKRAKAPPPKALKPGVKVLGTPVTVQVSSGSERQRFSLIESKAALAVKAVGPTRMVLDIRVVMPPEQPFPAQATLAIIRDGNRISPNLLVLGPDEGANAVLEGSPRLTERRRLDVPVPEGEHGFRIAAVGEQTPRLLVRVLQSRRAMPRFAIAAEEDLETWRRRAASAPEAAAVPARMAGAPGTEAAPDPEAPPDMAPEEALPSLIPDRDFTVGLMAGALIPMARLNPGPAALLELRWVIPGTEGWLAFGALGGWYRNTVEGVGRSTALPRIEYDYDLTMMAIPIQAGPVVEVLRLGRGRAVFFGRAGGGVIYLMTEGGLAGRDASDTEWVPAWHAGGGLDLRLGPGAFQIQGLFLGARSQDDGQPGGTLVSAGYRYEY